jgi:hypothetical protein
MTTEASGKPGPHSVRAERREPAVDLYELLEVSPRASEPVIQAAYRVLARQSHPDTNPELADPAAERRIRQLNAAYEVLSDSRARARYDHERAVARRAERLSGLERAVSMSAVPNAVASVPVARSRVLPSRPTMATAEDRFPVFHASTVFLLLLVAGVIVLSLLFVWTVLDSSRDDTTFYTPPPPVVVTGR